MIAFESLSDARQNELVKEWEIWFEEHGYDYYYESGSYLDTSYGEYYDDSFERWLKRVHDIKY